jgi:cation diffusion facilitator CzcD-associated flavoprotein CzcO
MTYRRVVVVGAGPAGLAAAAALARAGIRPLVLERSGSIGASWRGRYDRLRLNSSRPFSKLPRTPYPRGTAMFPTRDQMVSYLERYAERHALDVRLNSELERLDREHGGWVLRTSSGEVSADHVILASGYAHTPYIPDWPGRDRFRGQLLHSGHYRNPEPFRGGDVLVVGSGSSGMEIAHELASSGARRVRLAVRTSPNIILRSPIGPLLARLMMKLPTHRADRLIAKVSRKEIGDLSAYGLPQPEEGVFSRLKRLGVAPAIVDKETIEAIKDGRIEIVAGVESLDETGVELSDGTRVEPDAVIAATGYRTGLAPMVGHLDVLDERGVPRVLYGEAAPGLRFIGYDPRPAHLGYMAGEAKRTAQAIARELGGSSARRPAATVRRLLARAATA